MISRQHADAGENHSLERGEFRDSLRAYKVRVSSNEAPDSFQVYTGPREDIVLIVSGLNSRNLKATWGPAWRGAEEEWKVWVEECAFSLIIGVQQVGARVGDRPRPDPAAPIRTTPASERFCDG